MPRRPCIVHRCPDYADDGPRCPRHKDEFQKARKGWTTGQRGMSGKWRRIRRRALARDRYRCQGCGITDDHERELHGKGLSVHHKDEDPSNNALTNLESLCRACHQSRHSSPPAR